MASVETRSASATAAPNAIQRARLLPPINANHLEECCQLTPGVNLFVRAAGEQTRKG
jgi:hypothetical protein